MKYLVVLCDGMADTPNAALNGKTPMECANKPNMDSLAKDAEVGMCRTVAAGLKPGSDVANLSVMGYDPAVCYTGRSPLEAASIGVDLKPTDVALRCNTVTLSNEENYEDKTMVDYCAGDISTEEAHQIIETVEKELQNQLSGTGIARWTTPRGGYFISLYVLEGCAKRVEQLCANAGMILTPAGATYPYGNDPKDSNIRIAPSYPSVEEIEKASEVLALAVRYAALEKLLADKEN